MLMPPNNKDLKSYLVSLVFIVVFATALSGLFIGCATCEKVSNETTIKCLF